jgi:hypothetical protein
MQTNQMNYSSLIYFVKNIHMFWAYLHVLSIIRRYSLYMYSNWYVLYV